CCLDLGIRADHGAVTHSGAGTDVRAAADTGPLTHERTRAHPDGGRQVGARADPCTRLDPAAGAQARVGAHGRVLVHPGVLLDPCTRVDGSTDRDHAATVLVPAVPHDRAVLELQLLVLLLAHRHPFLFWPHVP